MLSSLLPMLVESLAGHGVALHSVQLLFLSFHLLAVFPLHSSDACAQLALSINSLCVVFVHVCSHACMYVEA